MKNITTVRLKRLLFCDICEDIGFFHYTPYGADYSSCPLCENFCEYESDISGSDKKISLCPKCLILFDFYGCTHAEQGCTDSILNGHFISKWENKLTGDIYVGMPQFDEIEDWVQNMDNIKILEKICPNKGIPSCKYANYNESEFPQYYEKCDLSKDMDGSIAFIINQQK